MTDNETDSFCMCVGALLSNGNHMPQGHWLTTASRVYHSLWRFARGLPARYTGWAMKQSFVVILGREPALSFAELVASSAHTGLVARPILPAAALLEGDGDAQQAFAELGGAVKLGRVCARRAAGEGAAAWAMQELLRALQEVPGHKPVFGISRYGSGISDRDVRQLAVNVKKALKEDGRAARYLAAVDGTLSSVVVAKQGLLEHQTEFLLIAGSDEWLLARSVAVQDFAAFSRRDYGRPGRNARSGMLPPKLARMMIHLARPEPGSTLLDPFCGSGTVLQEALFLGVSKCIGSDNSARAIQEAKANLAWLHKHEKPSAGNAIVLQSDIRSLSRRIPASSIGAIVTEPLLGPPLSGRETSSQLADLQRVLAKLYEEAFSVFLALLKRGGRVVFLFPVFFHDGKPRYMMNLDALLLKGFVLLQPLPPSTVALYHQELTYRHTLLYHRPGQRLGREVVIFEKKSPQ